MAETFLLDSTDSLTIDEYVSEVRENIDFRDIDSIRASAPAFRSFLNNPVLLTDIVNAELTGLIQGDINNPYTGQTFILAAHKQFMVRANVWVPPAVDPRIADLDVSRHYYSYLMPHDHNFTFMTGGYAGSGYETTIYEYDHARVSGHIGEAVDVRFLEKTSLPRGKIMLYRGSTDIHTQEHPVELSVSINLLVSRPDEQAKTQYRFDMDESGARLSGYVGSGASGNVTLCDFASLVGDEHTAGLLDAVSQSHRSVRVRAQSYLALTRLEPRSRAAILERASLDEHSYVRDFAAELWRNSSDNVEGLVSSPSEGG